MTTSDANADLDRQGIVVDHQPSGSDPAGEWLDTQTAMLRLGVSERTLFRRIRRGELRKRRRAGGRVEVFVPRPDRPPPTDAKSDADRRAEQNDQAERAIMLVERFTMALHEQIVPVLQQLDAANRRVAELARENGYLQAKVEELERRLAVTATEAESGCGPEGQ